MFIYCGFLICFCFYTPFHQSAKQSPCIEQGSYLPKTDAQLKRLLHKMDSKLWQMAYFYFFFIFNTHSTEKYS